MGYWKGATSKEYIKEDLSSFSKGMSKIMKKKFVFVNNTGGAYSDIVDVTSTVVGMDYNTVTAAAYMLDASFRETLYLQMNRMTTYGCLEGLSKRYKM